RGLVEAGARVYEQTKRKKQRKDYEEAFTSKENYMAQALTILFLCHIQKAYDTSGLWIGQLHCKISLDQKLLVSDKPLDHDELHSLLGTVD
ncbi:hypothetical protein X777_14677, partial [Ooceraea biroi]